MLDYEADTGAGGAEGADMDADVPEAAEAEPVEAPMEEAGAVPTEEAARETAAEVNLTYYDDLCT